MRARLLNEDIVPGYRVKFRIGDAWKQAKRMDVTNKEEFDEFKSLIMPKVRRLYKKMKTYMEDEDQIVELKQIIRDLSNAHDADDWDFAWDDFYDWCEENSVWVDAKDGAIDEAEAAEFKRGGDRGIHDKLHVGIRAQYPIIGWMEKVVGHPINIEPQIGQVSSGYSGDTEEGIVNFKEFIKVIEDDLAEKIGEKVSLEPDMNVGPGTLIPFVGKRRHNMLFTEDDEEYQIMLQFELDDWEPEDRLSAAGWGIGTWDGDEVEEGLTTAQLVDWMEKHDAAFG